MTSEQNAPDDTTSQGADVDQQDGGPVFAGSGGSSEDVASGGGKAGGEISATETRDGAGKISDDADAAGG